MTIDDARGVLHIGAPKCGSSALQTVLSASPTLTGPGGDYRYVGLTQVRGRLRLLEGEALRREAVRSPYGYVTCPNLPRGGDAPELWRHLEPVLTAPDAACPILSCEGWIAHSGPFAAQLSRMGNPRLSVFAYVRPPLDWLNAAFWQWGVWTGLRFDQWYARAGMKYRLGAQLEAWARIPNVVLRIRSVHDDVVACLSADLQVTLPPPPLTNGATPPAVVGFLMRNRERFRPSPLVPATEFVIKRWCTDLPHRALWALNAEDVQNARVDNRPDVHRLLALLPDPETLTDDPRWTQEKPYHPRVLAGRDPIARHHRPARAAVGPGGGAGAGQRGGGPAPAARPRGPGSGCGCRGLGCGAGPGGERADRSGRGRAPEGRRSAAETSGPVSGAA